MDSLIEYPVINTVVHNVRWLQGLLFNFQTVWLCTVCRWCSHVLVNCVE